VLVPVTARPDSYREHAKHRRRGYAKHGYVTYVAGHHTELADLRTSDIFGMHREETTTANHCVPTLIKTPIKSSPSLDLWRQHTTAPAEPAWLRVKAGVSGCMAVRTLGMREQQMSPCQSRPRRA